MLTSPDPLVTLKGDAPADEPRAALQAIYDQVPRTLCECDRPGQCCELTDEEIRSDFATMYPLYAVEYRNIVDYVELCLPPGERDRVLAVTEEQPSRCPFLTEERRCAIHPARPLTCRTYGVLRSENLLGTARRNAGKAPSSWINAFLTIESTTVCADSRVLEPERVTRHEDRMIRGDYERALLDLSRSAPLLDENRRRLLRDTVGLDGVTRWSWGGFNAMVRSSEAWFRESFREYWRRSKLGGN